MDPVAIVQWLLSFAGSIPKVGPYIQIALQVVIGLPLVITGFMAAWQGVVKLLEGLGKMPGLSICAKWSYLLKEDHESVSKWENGFLLPLLNRLSAIAPPVVKEEVKK